MIIQDIKDDIMDHARKYVQIVISSTSTAMQRAKVSLEY